ncbi:MAG: Stp1/IreP family PP2C-type Ser/Thr phosphatase [Acidimicrobiales bacterium]
MTVLRSGSATDVGRVRTVNQDLPLERPNLYAVADGMGGHVGGEVAARVAVATLEQAFERAPTVAGLREAVSEANTAVWHESQANADLRGMGTTLTALALVGGTEGRDMLALANVGDSRAYVFSDGDLIQVSDDHSLAEERMRHGEMTEAEAAVHPQRHILTRALGVSSEVDTDMWELELRAGDRVLLCSDGLSNEVETEEMASVLRTVADPQDAAQRLVDVANDHGGADNITVVIVDVQVGEEGSATASKVTPLTLGAAAVPAATVALSAAQAVSAEDVANGSPGVASTGSSAPSAATTTRPGVREDDTLAPGARLSFGDETTTLADSGPGSDEFLLGTAASVPVARSTARVPPPPVERVPEKENRAARRRRLGIPRRVTFRVIGFILLVAAVPVAAYLVLRWYAYDNWVVTVQGNQVVVKQGQQGGVLWFHPKIVDRTGYTVSQIDPNAVAPVKSGVQESSLDAAKRYVDMIIATTTATTTTTTTTTPHPAVASTTSTSGPSTTTTTAPTAAP